MIPELVRLSRGRSGDAFMGADAGAMPAAAPSAFEPTAPAVRNGAAPDELDTWTPPGDAATATFVAVQTPEAQPVLEPTFIAARISPEEETAFAARAYEKFGADDDPEKAAAYAFGEPGAEALHDAAIDPPPSWSDSVFFANTQAIRNALNHRLIGSAYPYAMANRSEEQGDVRAPLRNLLANRNVPAWMLDELTSMALDGAPIPLDQSLATTITWDGVGADHVNTLARAIAARLPDRLTHVILTPWLDSGGAERVALWHAMAVHEVGGVCVVIGTDRRKTGWVSRLPETAQYICLNGLVEEVGLAGHMGADDWAAALGIALAQVPFEVMHVINSYVGTRMLRHPIDWGRRRIFYSLFGIGVDKHGLEAGYWFSAHEVQGVTMFLSDNAIVPNQRAGAFGLSPENFRSIDYPVEASLKFTGVKRQGEWTRRVLWASRLDPEKQPLIVFDIARRMPGVEFHMFGSGVLTDGEMPRPPRNVWMRGPFDGWEGLPGEQFDCFLMTSNVTEGMPNIVLEAMGSGLPVVASSVGAVPEALAQKRGWLVTDVTDPEAYVTALTAALDDTAEANRRARAALMEVTRNRTFKKMMQALRDVRFI